MKKSFKLGLGILILGLFLVATSLFSGQKLAITFDGMRPVLYSQYEAKNYHKHKENLATSDIKTLTLDTSNVQLVIKTGKKFTWQYQSWDKKPDVKVINGNLTIKQHSKEFHYTSVFDFDWINDKPDKIILIVPENFEFEQVRLVVRTAKNVNINGLKTKNMSFAAGYLANLKINDSRFENLNLDLNGEEVELDNTIVMAGNMNLESQLVVSSSTLKDVAVNNEYRIEFSNVSLCGGKLSTNGNVNVINSNITRGYQIINESNDTYITNTTADGYWLISDEDNGSLKLFDKTGSKTLTKDHTKENCLKIMTNDGVIKVN